MKISDELRGWADVHCGEECVEYLGMLADRIDNEMVELPKDADGVPIRVGDTIYTEDGGMDDVIGIYFMQYKVNIVCRLSDGGSIVCAPHELSHERPDSLERIADDIEKTKGTVFISESTLDGWVERIRKLAKKEERDGD